MRLEGKVVVVTGASRGIGAGIARCMAREGAEVVVNYLRSEEQAYQVVKDIEISGRKAMAIKADVGDYQQVESMIDQAVGHFGKLDIVVSNAGISGGDKPLADTTPQEFFEVINNHLLGAYNCAHASLPYLRKNTRGDIQFISSRKSDFCPPNSPGYNAAKAGMEALAKSLAKEERYNGIRVNAVAPGFTDTPNVRNQIKAMTGMEDMDEIDSRQSLGRLVRPEDIGNLCVFLASDEGSHISGEVIHVRSAVAAEPTPYYIYGSQR